MMKKNIIIATGLFLLLEAGALASLFLSFRPDKKLADRTTSSAPPIASVPAIPKKLFFSAGDKTQISSKGEFITRDGIVNEAALGRELLSLAGGVNRPSQNAELTIMNGRATHFVPDLAGQDLDLAAARRAILAALAGNTTSTLTVVLPVAETKPQQTLADLNSLGIATRLVRGQSDFSGSSAARINNIRVGAERYKGIILGPGEEFSFNKLLGPVDGAHGFSPELVIKPEGTIPEFGGGLCQVSTTAFRAAFFGGLPITARRNHAYAVKYYEWIADDRPRAPGLDATIYPGASDMKFRNDTPASLLIWTQIEGTRLYFDFYGAADGRQVTVDGPRAFDRKPDGAVKSTVTRKVVRDGEVAELTLTSNYVSPDKYPHVTEYPKPVETPLLQMPVN